jgi:hypothetical protein
MAEESVAKQVYSNTFVSAAKRGEACAGATDQQARAVIDSLTNQPIVSWLLWKAGWDAAMSACDEAMTGGWRAARSSREAKAPYPENSVEQKLWNNGYALAQAYNQLADAAAETQRLAKILKKNGIDPASGQPRR